MLLSFKKYAQLSQGRYYPLFLGVSAFFLMLFGLIPCEVMLVPAVVSAPRRWKSFFMAAALGSALGAAALTWMIFVLGSPVIHHFFPSLQESSTWALGHHWILNYGTPALVLIAILPIAQTPAIALAGLFEVPAWSVFLAFLLGKWIKYGVVSHLTLQTQMRVQQFRFFRKKKKH